MIRLGLRPVLAKRQTPRQLVISKGFVIHNDGFTIERSIHGMDKAYNDFKILIDTRLANVPASCDKDRQDLKQKILDKASGSFLWVSLVMDMLAKSYSEEATEEILQEVPTDMNSLYSEMLGKVLQNRRAVVLARSLYMWTLLSSRPLKVDGLQVALKLDTNQTVHNLDKPIPTLSGQLVTVNQQHEAEIIHQTAKSYLLQQDMHSDLALNKVQSHTRMAHICLGILAGNSTKTQPPRTLPRSSASFLSFTVSILQITRVSISRIISKEVPRMTITTGTYSAGFRNAIYWFGLSFSPESDPCIPSHEQLKIFDHTSDDG